MLKKLEGMPASGEDGDDEDDGDDEVGREGGWEGQGNESVVRPTPAP